MKQSFFRFTKRNFFERVKAEHKRLGGVETSSNGAWLTSKIPDFTVGRQ